MDFNLIEFNTIESTNVWARKNLDHLSDCDIVCADIQTSGHGQFGRKWFSSSDNGGNAYFSIILKPDNIEHLNELTRYTSSIISKTLLLYGIKSNFKFPNDVLIEGKKISGVLADSVFVGQAFLGVVVGVGINLNLNEMELKNIDIPATSIFIETGRNVDKHEFLNKFLELFFESYHEFLNTGLKEELVYTK